ncbi:MAG: type III-A CRISPR-associated protein Csm2 [Alphaproteobacteria bacterium]|nr:type III-A CRISPR-associated protein Csm2 [Alphaproteobacteria bacterium]
MSPPPNRGPGGSQGRPGGSQGQRHGGARTSDPPPAARLPDPRPVTYFTDRGRKALAADIVGDKADALARASASVPASQIRRFYGDVIGFDRRLAAERDLPADAVQAQMALLKAKAAYAFRRARRDEFPDALLQFFVDHAASVKDREDFAAFRRAFEAVIAYHKFYEQKSQRD